VSGSGAGLGAAADQLRSITKTVTGDGQILAAVTAAEQPPGSGAQAGLLVRQTPDPASPFYAVLLTPNGLVVSVRIFSISLRTASSCPEDVSMMPMPPAFETALASWLRAIQPIGACTIGYLTPSSSVTRF